MRQLNLSGKAYNRSICTTQPRKKQTNTTHYLTTPTFVHKEDYVKSDSDISESDNSVYDKSDSDKSDSDKSDSDKSGSDKSDSNKSDFDKSESDNSVFGQNLDFLE